VAASILCMNSSLERKPTKAAVPKTRDQPARRNLR